jgi:exonuclease VII small subunit
MNRLGMSWQRLWNHSNQEVPLSKNLWERGEALAKICQEWLDGAKAKIAASRSTQEAEAE